MKLEDARPAGGGSWFLGQAFAIGIGVLAGVEFDSLTIAVSIGFGLALLVDIRERVSI